MGAYLTPADTAARPLAVLIALLFLGWGLWRAGAHMVQRVRLARCVSEHPAGQRP